MERRVVVILSAALVIALIAIAYLLGRESVVDRKEAARAVPSSPAGAASAGPQTAPVGPSADTPAALTAAPAAQATTPGELRGSAPRLAESPTPTAEAGLPPVHTEPGAQSANPDSALRGEVARYFQEIEAVQAEGRLTGDPQEVASQVLTGMANGDGKGFDQLVETQTSVLKHMRAINAPAPCHEHFVKSLGAIEEAVRILQQTREAVASSDIRKLEATRDAGQELESRVHEIDQLAASIKKQYGL